MDYTRVTTVLFITHTHTQRERERERVTERNEVSEEVKREGRARKIDQFVLLGHPHKPLCQTMDQEWI